MGAKTLTDVLDEAGVTDEDLQLLADSDLRIAPVAEQLLEAKRREESSRE